MPSMASAACQVANMAWAVAAAGEVAPALFEAIARETPLRLGEADAPCVASLVWAFAVVDCRHHRRDAELQRPDRSAYGEKRQPARVEDRHAEHPREKQGDFSFFSQNFGKCPGFCKFC